MIADPVPKSSSKLLNPVKTAAMATSPKSSGTNNRASITGTINENINCETLRNADHLKLVKILALEVLLFNLMCCEIDYGYFSLVHQLKELFYLNHLDHLY